MPVEKYANLSPSFVRTMHWHCVLCRMYVSVYISAYVCEVRESWVRTRVKAMEFGASACSSEFWNKNVNQLYGNGSKRLNWSRSIAFRFFLIHLHMNTSKTLFQCLCTPLQLLMQFLGTHSSVYLYFSFGSYINLHEMDFEAIEPLFGSIK